jgi:undecaprenyl diphosphate synthase
MVQHAPLSGARLPRHVAIIMDGNGRWAKARGLPRNEGHRQGAQSVRKVLNAAQKAGVPMLTLYAFSTENWKRPVEEINGLWRLLDLFLKQHLKDLIEQKTRLNVLGRRAGLPDNIQKRIEEAMSKTAHFEDYQCNVALNYSARDEVVDAAQRFAKAVQSGQVETQQLDWAGFSKYLYTSGLPDPDLLIRTSGEARLSNFLLMQLAYAELYFTDTLWPDFDEHAFEQALAVYQKRERRYGQTAEQMTNLTSQQLS